MVEGAGAHLDQNFVGAHARLGPLLVAQNFGASVLVKDDCFHN
jgi:hypothetical protein